ncbi:hypothetical protein HPB47_025144 [Ixodes persulcatus]|uniref:Uncharacterized protein n=1 Tax=Ixodes persulcatus TaxID=34615 RepID=A0AC60Q4E6_IXOPE|nr:hypothetical protein HPB47_025144 [Ixodes persulcatus]
MLSSQEPPRQKKAIAARNEQFASREFDLIFGNVYALPRVPRPPVRDRKNPIERYNVVPFLAKYCFPKRTVRMGTVTTSVCRCPQYLQLLMALRFDGAAAFQVVTGDFVNVFQPIMCRTVGLVTRLIGRHLFKKLVHFPHVFQLNTVMREFYEMDRFPGVTGCIDCTRVRSSSPGRDDAQSPVKQTHLKAGKYNKAHISTRNSVERAFGVWKRRFPCLDMRLQHKPGCSASIVTVCAALHNPACLRKEPQPPPPLPPPVRRRVRNTRRSARRPVHLPPVDAVQDTLTGIQTREIIIEKSFF